MNTKNIGLILSAVQAAILAAPQVLDVAAKARDFVKSLFDAGVIPIARQNEVMSRVDAICAAAIAGEEPPHWTVEPDPE